MNLISKHLKLLSNKITKVHKINIRNYSLKALKKEHVTNLNQETLTGRILLYLNIDNKNYNVNILKEQSSSIRVDCLNKFTTNEIISYINSLNHQTDINKAVLFSLLNKFDTELCLRLPELDVKTILKLLNTFMNLIPHRITECKFYKLAITKLLGSVSKLDKQYFLQLMFYIGLQKKNSNASGMLRKCIGIVDNKFISSLTVEELCIICNSTFKTSTKIVNKAFLNQVKQCIHQNLFILKDPALFITLLKTIRHNRYQDDNLLATVSSGIFFNRALECYSFSGCCHILALYADYLYFDQSILDIFTKRCLEQLKNSSFECKNTYLLEQPRGKDIKRFLWVLSIFSEFNLVSKKEIELIIIPKLLERIKSGEFDNDINSLVDITLYLWMINYKPKEIVPYVLSQERLKLLETRSKSKLRLNLLLYCISTEDHTLFKTLQIRPKSFEHEEVSYEFQLKQRPLLKHILDHLNVISSQFQLGNFKISQEVKFLNVFGITGYKRGTENKTVFVEILDDYTCIKNVHEDIPGGMMALKLRLLDSKPQGVLVVSQKEIAEMTESEIKELLIEELKLIC